MGQDGSDDSTIVKFTYTQAAKGIWRFPEIGVPPVVIHF